jgi:hypothetical protein
MQPMAVIDRKPTLQPPMLCVADVDTRLSCTTFCAACPLYVRDRRAGERRNTPRRTHDRRVLGRL